MYGLLSESVDRIPGPDGDQAPGRHFVDLNDLRVARSDEIVDLFGEDSPAVREAAGRLTRVLMAVFNKFHVLTLTGIKKMGKRPAKQVIEALDGVSPYAVDYCMLTSLQGHAVPLNGRMIEYLKAEGLIHRRVGARGDRGIPDQIGPGQGGLRVLHAAQGPE